MVKADSLDEVLKMNQKKSAAKIGVVEEQSAQFDAASAKLANSKNRQDEIGASTATCQMKLLQVQLNFASAFKMVKASSTRAVALAKERNTVTTKHEEQRLCLEQHACALLTK